MGLQKISQLRRKDIKMNRNFSFVNDMRNNVEEYDEMDKIIKMKTLLRMASNKIKCVRETQLSERRRLEKYEKASTSPSSYEYLKSATQTYISDCKMYIKLTLTLNQKICENMSSLQRNRSRMASGKVNVTERDNVQRLHDTNVVKKICQHYKNTHLMKQHSGEWCTIPFPIMYCALTIF